MIDLSVIIVNWNTCDLLAKSLESVYSTVKDLTLEVFVVDNASTDGSPEMVRQRFPQAQLLVNSENLGFARANNQAIRQCQGKYVLLLNSDAALTGGAANALVDALENDPKAGIAGAQLLYPDGRPQVSHGPLPTFWTELAGLTGLDRGLQRVDWKDYPGRSYIQTGMVNGACLLARRSMLDLIGLLDERFFMFNEEVDLCFRAHAAAWKVIYVPAAVTFHVAGGSTGVTSGRLLRLYRGKLQYFHKHYGPGGQRRLKRAMRAVTAVKVAFYTLASRAGLTRSQKENLWREVARGLVQLQI
ncbi:MAG TPA: glycosyltransferase family 2 protein [Anaerolineales bacterium]